MNMKPIVENDELLNEIVLTLEEAKLLMKDNCTFLSDENLDGEYKAQWIYAHKDDLDIRNRLCFKLIEDIQKKIDIISDNNSSLFPEVVRNGSDKEN